MGGLQYAGFIVPILLILVALEYFVSKRKGVDVYSLEDTLVNACCGMLERLFDFFWVVMMYFVFAWLFENVALWHIPNNPATWFAGFLLGDFLAYWHHRLSHQINFMWAAHIVHHQSEELNMTTVFRVSAFAVINRAFFWIWMPILGFNPAVTTSIIVVIGLYQFVSHTRLVNKMGILEKFMVTPSHHRVHHARNEKYLDMNYGHVFIIWDKMLGTFREEEEEPNYGITTGFESSSPYRAYFFYWKDLFRRAGEATHWQDKIKIFLKPPSWNPEGAISTPEEYSVDENGNRKKYRLQTPFRLQMYTFLSVLVTMGAFVSLLILKRTFELPSIGELLASPKILTLTLITIYSIFAHGVIMERKRWALRADYLRLALWAVAIPILLWGTPYAAFSIAGAYIVLAVFAFWLIRMRNFFENPESQPEKVKRTAVVSPVREIG